LALKDRKELVRKKLLRRQRNKQAPRELSPHDAQVSSTPAEEQCNAALKVQMFIQIKLFYWLSTVALSYIFFPFFGAVFVSF